MVLVTLHKQDGENYSNFKLNGIKEVKKTQEDSY